MALNGKKVDASAVSERRHPLREVENVKNRVPRFAFKVADQESARMLKQSCGKSIAHLMEKASVALILIVLALAHLNPRNVADVDYYAVGTQELELSYVRNELFWCTMICDPMHLPRSGPGKGSRKQAEE
eukprot:CAMPEP_0181130222 /NCGR_PEP_ID=MMETSP1071-20121207/29744_1 /TAXON_ID=35127 /ORGANISM="Thalassiosira sp., Strain NH16" /LENGTH=129 /DNA_ID=CAMNT_0023216269 /DNA_START=136 /DNA_END=526 /DNA_ORIENTATION=-